MQIRFNAPGDKFAQVLFYSMFTSKDWKSLFCLVSDELRDIERREEEVTQFSHDMTDEEFLASLRALRVSHTFFYKLQSKVWDELMILLDKEDV